MIEEYLTRFPILRERQHLPAGSLSGGQQQMLAISRGLMASPRLLLLDEPSLGLAPLIVKQIFEIISELRRAGKTILLVEQMANLALKAADRAYVIERGEVVLEGSARELLSHPRVTSGYLGRRTIERSSPINVVQNATPSTKENCHE
jgi:branched-chain amino acid transport system ATP-binding protein